MLKKAKWPNELMIPSPSDFTHEAWIDTSSADGLDGEDHAYFLCTLDHGDERSVFHEGDREKINNCGVKCCLVGWVCFAFDEPGFGHENIRNPATVRFLHKFLKIANHGEPPPLKNKQGEFQTKEIVDYAIGVFDNGRPGLEEGRLEPEDAHEIWKQTAEHFGYDTSVKIKLKVEQ